MTEQRGTPAVHERVRTSFGRQAFLRLLGADIRGLATGTLTLVLPARPELHQQHGFVHAGAVATLLDTACGFAALTVMDDGVGVLTAEYKVNLLRPAVGDVVVAEAQVATVGRTLVVCTGRAWAESGGVAGGDVALMTATIAIVRDRADVVD